jgi:hypothetical protein
MFTWINSLGVRSDQGFEVESLDAGTEVYREGDRTVAIPVERGATAVGPAVIVEPTIFRHWDGESVEIPADRQAVMMANFVAAMEFRSVTVSIEARFGPGKPRPNGTWQFP